MKSLFHLFTHDDTYGPGTDLAMALLGIFILSAAIAKKNNNEKDTVLKRLEEKNINLARESNRHNERLKKIAANQVQLINALAQHYETTARYEVNGDDSVYIITAVTNDGQKEIAVRNSTISQLFTFDEKLLFEPADAELIPEGAQVIADLGSVIRDHISLLDEIQIQGHADTTLPDSMDYYQSNIELASARATEVFTVLKDVSTIDPSDILLSIVSYGEYNPVERRKNRNGWNRQRLNDANDTSPERSRNRRIEILLIYK